ncbi:glycosyltransferase family 39 protein [Paenibacillus segetis]|uniref:Dolichyl-phosphate-mannose--protein mannosyltransferase n=1 Tax=Paenibacillus segetis TaxID=1325360 RepID=A0ABQ1YVK0_9BACL|nr:glycosyltransferase family 39 protein [Paenibacillus segetis]GGH38740.1 hypothetical protein GCM10008013_47040 [Paenibacillus segetis]
MSRITKYVVAIGVLLLLVSLNPARIFAAENLIQNGGFENAQSAVPEFWSQDVWVTEESASQLSVESGEVHSGNSAAVVNNFNPDHAKWVQKVSVEANSYYKISGWVKVVQMEEAATAGANLFILGVMGDYPQLITPSGTWEEISFYGQTGPDQQDVSIGAGIGAYGTLVAGKALFDDISVEKVDKPGQGISVISMFAPENQGQDENKQEEVTKKPVSVLPVLAITVLFSLLFAFVYTKMLRKQWQEILRPDYKMWLSLSIVTALIIRIWIAVAIPGYTGDLYTFMGWADRVVTQGMGHFYQDGVFADYPPGYMYVLYLLGSIKSVFGLESTSVAARLLFKLPAILGDLTAGIIIYRSGQKRFGKGLALGLMLLYLFNPGTLVNSAAWGQMDGFFVIFLILAIISNTEGRMERSAVWFAIAVLIKPQALIFTPVLLLAFLYRRDWKRVLYSAGYGLAAFVLLSLPFFWGNGGFVALVNLYKSTLSSYPYASVNAFNLFALTGGNWVPIDQKWLLLSYQTWGNISILVATALAVYFFMGKAGKKAAASYFIGLVLISVVFILGPKMHERYMFPALILCLFCFIQSKDRRFLSLYFGFSVTQFVNVAYVLHSYTSIGQGPPTDGIVMLCSIGNLGLLAYMLYLGYDIYYLGKRRLLQPITEQERVEKENKILSEIVKSDTKPKRGDSRFLRRKDWIWIVAITLLYTALALNNLGSMKDPQTVWEPRAAGENFYVDLGDTKQLAQMNIFGGVGSGKYKIEFGNSPDEWSQAQEVDPTGKVFEWNIIPIDVSARYAKLTVETPGFMLHEIAFFEQGKSTPTDIKEIYADNATGSIQGTPANLFDESSSVAYKQSYLNSTYFDEIYHARTAYEHLHGIVPYENTHPPLGKLLIAIGIKLFGVTPFGWRIVGTLFGAGMLPIIYVFALRLFGKREYAVTAALLFALDFMHFTLTRIATIDVYGVFFIMLMFYFMYRYVSQNFYLIPLRKTLNPLFLSGLFFGIGVASKWIVLYGGAGLAIMLGISLYERYRQSVAASKALAKGGLNNATRLAYEHAARSFGRNCIITLASCIGFFIIIPLIIYSLAFIPSLTASQAGFTIKGLIQEQTNMYHYHSQLQSTHPFASSWWEWPFMKRPVWFYSAGDQVDPGLVSSIVTMGNPLVWWSGIFAMLLTIWFTIKRKDKRFYVIWIAFLSQYVPWMLVPRSTFLYHYFAMVPFMILGIIYMMKVFESKFESFKYIRYSYIAVAALLFIMFYPVLSGMVVKQSYVDHILRWFQTWVF